MIASFISCKNSKWENIDTNVNPKVTPYSIYFKNTNEGMVGGYILKENSKSTNYDKLEMIPQIFKTKDGGKSWNKINLNNKLQGNVTEVYFSNDSIICRIESINYLSIDSGKYWKDFNKTFLPFQKNCYDIKMKRDFSFRNEKFYIKEYYENSNIILIICYGKESLTDYYFSSRKNSQQWKLIQKDYGSNLPKFLTNDNYLLSLDSQGLKKLNLN